MTDTQTLVQIAELYYHKKWTQKQIADKYGVSRVTISRLLDLAREKGIVKISIQSIINRRYDLERPVKDKYGLKDIVVFNSTKRAQHDSNLLGIALSDYLQSILQNGFYLGISWGSAVQSLVNQLTESDFSDINVVQINGGLQYNSGKQTVAGLIISTASKLNGNVVLLDAPAYVDNQILRDELLKQSQIKRAFDLMETLDIVITGIGNLDEENNTLYNSGILSKYDLISLKNKGAVGHIAGRMYDTQSNEISIDGKFPIAIELETFKQIPYSIGAATTKERAFSTHTAIKNGYLNVLICDESLASALLMI